MTKQYSINWRDGEMVSFEVDGVEYSEVDDIPDAGDRGHVRRLIARSSEVKSEPDFDPSFDKEFEA